MKQLLLTAIMAVLAGLSSLQAQTYPARPITIVVPFPAGGPTDLIARVKDPGQSEMRAGVGGVKQDGFTEFHFRFVMQSGDTGALRQ